MIRCIYNRHKKRNEQPRQLISAYRTQNPSLIYDNKPILQNSQENFKTIIDTNGELMQYIKK